MNSSNLSASSSLVLFLEDRAKMFLILPLRTNPRPFLAVTNGSHAYATSSEKSNEPIDHMLGTVFPA